MRIRSVALAAVAALALAPLAGAQQSFTSLAGPWWFSLGGKDSGALLVEFSEPNGTAFTVTDVSISDHPSCGFSRALAAFFQIAADQPLALDAKGNVTGALTLSAPGGGAIGTLSFTKGRPNKSFTKLKLAATLDGGAGPLVVKLAGVRPSDFPVLTGHTATASLGGKGAKSKLIDLGVASDTELGLPAYTWTAHGPLLLDKLPVADTTLAGRVMLDPKFRAHGLLQSSSDFGTGAARGSLVLPGKASTTPKLALSLEANRKLGLKGSLVDPVEPVLSVTPISFDFGALHLGDTKIQLFSVQNVGVGTLSGSASFVAPTADFQLIGSPDYMNLAPGDPPVAIAVAFDPLTMGDKSATVHFGIDTGVGAKRVAVSGVGGIAVLSVDPDPLAFGGFVVGTTTTKTITLTNTGDGTLTGRARLSGSSDFALITPPNTLPVSQISYSLAPGASKDITVQFQPSGATSVMATLNLTGGDGADVPVTGTGL